MVLTPEEQRKKEVDEMRAHMGDRAAAMTDSDIADYLMNLDSFCEIAILNYRHFI